VAILFSLLKAIIFIGVMFENTAVAPIEEQDRPKIESLTPTDLTSNSNSPSPLVSPSETKRRSGGKKVSFSADTFVPLDDNIALSITKHAYTKDLGCTQYSVDVSTQFN
jgi:hypothetical protein